jgi:hypothetical protein
VLPTRPSRSDSPKLSSLSTTEMHRSKIMNRTSHVIWNCSNPSMVSWEIKATIWPNFWPLYIKHRCVDCQARLFRNWQPAPFYLSCPLASFCQGLLLGFAINVVLLLQQNAASGAAPPQETKHIKGQHKAYESSRRERKRLNIFQKYCSTFATMIDTEKARLPPNIRRWP